MSIDKFTPLSPDPDLNSGSDMTIARFGHLNKLVDEIATQGIYVAGEGNCSTVRYGVNNRALGPFSVVSGGTNNCTSIVNGYADFIGAGSGNCTHYETGGYGPGGSGIVAGWGNSMSGSYSFIGAGTQNKITYRALGSTISAGYGNTASHYSGGIVSGVINSQTNRRGFIGAGQYNTNSGAFAGIVAGYCNIATGTNSFSGGGNLNCVGGDNSAVVSGCNNKTTNNNSVVLGGSGNTANQPHSAVFGCNITTSMACALHTNRLVLTNLPNSSAGLPSGALWYDPADSNRVKYVP